MKKNYQVADSQINEYFRKMPEGNQQTINPVPEVTVPEDTISVATAGTLAGLFRERVRRSPQQTAYKYFNPASGSWKDSTWLDMAKEVSRWQAAMEKELLAKGDRVAVMMPNSREWVMLDQAALGLGLVVVPLYIEDRADNVEYILRDAGVKLLVVGGPEFWETIKSRAGYFDTVTRIILVKDIIHDPDPRVMNLSYWLPKEGGDLRKNDGRPEELATIVYTSGTTGRPKGVMLSHKNILSNAHSGQRSVVVTNREIFLSFLPLSHTLERTVGYYLPMMAGATVAYARSINELAQDLKTIRPTALICVPRIFERVYSAIRQQLEEKQKKYLIRLFDLTVDVGWSRYEYLQGRGKKRTAFLLWPLLKRLVADKITSRFGGRLKIIISGGAALSPMIAKAFIALGIPILQGYGLTEASPVVSVNRVDNNIPESIGPPLPGVEVKIGAQDELLVKADSVMLGYWNYPEETRKVIDTDGWLHTGDRAHIEGQHIYITGRLKDIIVMATGEKIPPGDMEQEIKTDALFEQIMIIGESRPYLTALVVLNEQKWEKTVIRNQLTANSKADDNAEEFLLERIGWRLRIFPGYAQVRRVTCTDEQWSIENDMLTPTLKVKRNKILEKYAMEIERMYEGHGT